jgi:hypothetical protein
MIYRWFVRRQAAAGWQRLSEEGFERSMVEFRFSV